MDKYEWANEFERRRKEFGCEPSITDFVEDIWSDFCEQYPIRLSAKSPEVKKYFAESSKVMEDMLLHGIGVYKHVDITDIKFDSKDSK